MSTQSTAPSCALDVFSCPLTGTTLIEASAGTGKTWAITGLFLRLIIERGLPIQHILVVTFTKAATAELRERIRDRLRDVLSALHHHPQAPSTPSDPFIHSLLNQALTQFDPSTVQQRLEAALALFDEAAIYTIHGYCQRALDDAPLTAGQPFERTLSEDQPWGREVTQDFWRTHIATQEDAELAHYLSTRLSPAMLETQLRRRLSKPLATLCWPKALDTPPSFSEITLETAYRNAQQLWASSKECAHALLTNAIEEKVLHGATYKHKLVAEGMRAWDAWLSAPSLPMAMPPAICERWCATLLTNKTNKAKTAPKETPTHPLFTALDHLWQTLLARQGNWELARLRLLREFLQRAPAEVQERKRHQRHLSFDDLLGNLYEALMQTGGTSLATQLAERYPVALIDEFQDTDPLQFAIFQQIYRQGNQPSSDQNTHSLFLVGDPKQAIYSFRQADLRTYLQARHYADHRFYLPDNQRSSATLIQAVNQIFSQHDHPFMLPNLAFQPVGFGQKPRGTLYDQRVKTSHTPHTSTALHCWQLPHDEPVDKSLAQRLAAAACAQEMADLLSASEQGLVRISTPDGTASHPLQPGDMAVLVRTNEQGRQMKAALAEVGLAAAELSTGSVFASTEAGELEQILLAIAEPGRVESLRAALATTWLGLTASELLALTDGPQEASVESSLSTWLLRFQQAHHRWIRAGLAATLQQCLSEWCICPKLLAQKEGERKLTNALHLIELLHGHETELGKIDMTALVRWLGQQRAEPYALGEAAQLRLESDEKLVRIVTIHRSKGLEYPIVFCPFIWEGPGKARDTLEGEEYPSLTQDNPPRADRFIDFRDPETPEQIAGKAMAAIEDAAESLRLMYVALTRAVHRCYLVTGPYLFNRGLKDSQRALLNWLVAGHDNPTAWLEDGGDWASIHHAWQTLSQTHPAITVVPLPAMPTDSGSPGLVSLQSNDTSDAAPKRSPPNKPFPLPVSWRLDSFTGLLRGAVHADATAAPSPVADYDALQQAADDILLFERGARAGECIHAVFESADFSDPATWNTAIELALQSHPPVHGGTDLSVQRLRHMLSDVLNTPLPQPAATQEKFTLAAVTPRDRLCELEFSLPVSRLSAARLQTICRKHGVPIPHLNFSDLAGYLRGFVDLVFRTQPEPDGPYRYAILDWKSNYLGDSSEHYTQTYLHETMVAHGYYLQAMIYCFALHRHLRRTLPDYNPEQHLGGAYYLFVRGVRPEWALNAPSSGIIYWHPSQALLGELDEALTS